jgi:hypothetical protein
MKAEAKRNPKDPLRKPRTPLPAGNVTKLIFGTNPGLLAAIERLRAAEIRASQDYELALSTNDPDLIARKKKDWCDLIEQLRKVEQSNPDILKANGQTLPVAEVERETARMCNAFRVALEALPRSLPQKLVGQDEATIQEALSKGINDALAQLHTGKWNTNA